MTQTAWREDIVAAARTAVGKFGGTLAKTPAPELGATVIKALLERSGPWRDTLALAEALERHDLDAAGELAGHFGGIDRVLTLSDEAWGWAASVQRELNT